MIETATPRPPGFALGEIWSPRTDGGVWVQIAVTVLVVAALAWVARGERVLVQLIVGVGMVVLAWYGVRALH